MASVNLVKMFMSEIFLKEDRYSIRYPKLCGIVSKNLTAQEQSTLGKIVRDGPLSDKQVIPEISNTLIEFGLAFRRTDNLIDITDAGMDVYSLELANEHSR